MQNGSAEADARSRFVEDVAAQGALDVVFRAIGGRHNAEVRFQTGTKRVSNLAVLGKRMQMGDLRERRRVRTRSKFVLVGRIVIIPTVSSGELLKR